MHYINVLAYLLSPGLAILIRDAPIRHWTIIGRPVISA